jgi:solute carrier family 20 (sodium-dependent phosphate transporter)
MDNYLWIVITGGFFSFIASMGIGANDVANSFATSIGAKSLTIKYAVILACIFETSGAILMGSHVSETIRKDIANYECFQEDPYTLMYGSMWVCFSVAVWLFTASYFEMPVSTTHSCIGGMIGMTIALKGPNCVIWYKSQENFPYIGGVSVMIISWIVSPLLSGIISSSIFILTRNLILRKNYEDKYIYYGFPFLVGITILLNTFFIVYKGAKGIGLHKTPLDIVLGVSFGIGLLSSVITIPFLPKLYNYINDKFSSDTTVNVIDIKEHKIDGKKIISITYNVDNTKTIIYNDNTCILTTLNDIILLDNNIDTDNNENSIINAIHNNAEKFDVRTEEFFKYLQIFSAACASFSHGANDVANAIGPFVAILTIYIENDVRADSVMNKNAYWILSLGGIGISLGLILYGYKIIEAIGIKLCKITPSRGAIIELSAAFVTILGSRFKIPLSTTHCQIGAICGVGLLESSWKNNISGINKKIIYKSLFGWIITCIFVGFITAILTAQGVYSPSL